MVWAAAALVLLGACRGGGSPSGPTVLPSPTTTPRVSIGEALATNPTRAQVMVGDDDCLDVLVADTPAERERGLMDRDDLGDADGMLFVWGADVDAPFYMFQTRISLDIGWFGPDGEPIDATTMDPCPAARPEDCPIYQASGRYRYALEVPAGELGSGAIAGCP